MKESGTTQTEPHSRSPISILRAFFVSAAGTGLSRVLGAARDIVIAHYFGAGKMTDAFWIAYTVPSVFRRFVADEGLTGAMIPAIAKQEKEQGTDAARLFTDRVFTSLLLALLFFCAAGILGAPYLVRLFAWGFTKDPAQFTLTVELTRWLFPFVAMVSLVSYCEGILNHRNHFFVPKIAPGIVSGMIVVITILFYNRFTPPIYAVVAGLLIGGCVHFMAQLPVLGRLWYFPRINFHLNTARMRFFLREMGKVILIGIFAQLNVVVLRLLASFLSPGSVTHYWNANRVVDLTHGMIAIGMSSALMPAVAHSAAAGDWKKLREQLEYSLKLAAFFLFPSCVFLLFFNEPVVAILFRHGNFTSSDAAVTASTLLLLTPFLLSLAGINIIKKVYFALDDRNTLLVVGGAGVALTAGIGALLIKSMGVQGLATALSISAIIQFFLYIVLLKRKSQAVLLPSALFSPLLKIVLSCVPFSFVLYFLGRLGDWSLGPRFHNLVILALGLFSTLVLFLVTAYFLKVPELHMMIDRLKRRYFKKSKV